MEDVGMTAIVGNCDDAEYNEFLNKIQARLTTRLAMEGAGKLFTTDLDPDALWEGYISSLPEDQRQYHRCNSCRHFITRFGDLVLIDANGNQSSAFWDTTMAPKGYGEAIAFLERKARYARVTGVFVANGSHIGIPENSSQKTGAVWHHFSVVLPPSVCAGTSELLNADQLMAAKKVECATVFRALADFPPKVTAAALEMLRSESLYRGEAVLGQAEWLHAIHEKRAGRSNFDAHNVVWRAVATAPAGFCHPRSSMVGTLLADIAVGFTRVECMERFAAKMAPDQYQRPQVPPTDGNIARAEEIFAKLGLAASLNRRFAKLEEIQTIWKPTPVVESADDKPGLFGHLRKVNGTVLDMDNAAQAVRISWSKFQRTVLPNAVAIEAWVADGPNWFCALTTAVDADAPPILQWDNPERRNPFSHYLYLRGSMPSQWSLEPRSYVEVTAVAEKPSMWFDKEDRMSHHSKGVIFILAGARDKVKSGAALFPQILKGELREVRSTIEAYSQTAELGGRDEASACGILIEAGPASKFTCRVQTTLGSTSYIIDHWD